MNGGSRLTTTVVAAVLAVAAMLLVGVRGTTAGFSAAITNSASSVSTASRFTCANTFASTNLRSSAYFEYQLTATTTTATASDSSAAGNPGTYQGSVTGDTARPIACPKDATLQAYQPNGSTDYVTTTTSVSNPTTFSLVIWFKTTVAGGYIIGFANAQTGSPSAYDRQLYVDTSGHLVFATYNGAYQTIATTQVVNDGVWHMAAATLSPSSGMKLYLDGALAVAGASYTTAENTTGWWRIGYGNLSGWPNVAANTYFTGSLHYAAAYSIELPVAEVAAEYRNGAPG